MIARKLILPGVISLATIAGAGATAALNNMASASAATTGTNSTVQTTPASKTQQQTPPDPSQGGHIGANGEKEVELTGDTATKAKAAAEAAVPNSTIIRVETDAEGAKYEAHMQKSDGSMVTVKMDANFKVTAIDQGMGGGGPGMAPNQNDSSSSSST